MLCCYNHDDRWVCVELALCKEHYDDNTTLETTQKKEKRSQMVENQSFLARVLLWGMPGPYSLINRALQEPKGVIVNHNFSPLALNIRFINS